MNVLKLLLSLVVSFAAAGIGSLATTSNISTWYAGLEKPFFTPPNWLFGPVWTLLYVLIALSLYTVWTQKTSKPKTGAYTIFGIQMILNALWSLVFFGLHWTWPGLMVIIALDICVIALIKSSKRISKPAAYLLIPYLAWICFATCLNLGIAVLN